MMSLGLMATASIWNRTWSGGCARARQFRSPPNLGGIAEVVDQHGSHVSTHGRA